MNSYQKSELDKCKWDIAYFANNYVHVYHDAVHKKFNLSKEQIRILRRSFVNRKYLLKSCRQFGKTTLLTILALHTLLFGKSERIIVVSNKSNSSDLLGNIIQHYIEFLPYWLAKNVERNSKNTWTFGDNILSLGSSSGHSMRGLTPTTLILDELAFYDTDFWKSIYPVVASSTKSKIKIFSTPKDRDDIVTQLYARAYEGENDFATDLVTWKNLPEEQQNSVKWIKEQLEPESFAAEFECQV